MEDFKIAYKAKFGQDVVIYAPYTYDPVMNMVQAMQEVKSADPKKYPPYLAKIHHKGVTDNIAFDNKGDIKDGSLILYTYKKGVRTFLAVTK